MNYIDSSAVLKLLFDEPESAELEQWVSQQFETPLVTSELTRVEVIRATRRLNPLVAPAARTLLSQVNLMPLTSDLLTAAGEIGNDLLRSLDAIHLASAASLGSAMTSLVAYDDRLLSAASDIGLPVIAPGAS